MKLNLGWTYIDKVTGFRGVAVGRVEYLTGCNQVLLVPRVDKDGKEVESKWLDEQRLDVDESAAPIQLNNEQTPGFDAPAPKY